MNLLLELTVRGAVIFGAVAALDALCRSRVNARSRQLWWLCVPVAFLLTIPWSSLPAGAAASLSHWPSAPALPAAGLVGRLLPAPAAADRFSWAPAILAAGSAIYLLVVLVRTHNVLRRWRRERLCTDSRLLGLLEDCKADAGVCAPIGLVVSSSAAAPVIVGWLRPRILLPADLAASMSAEQLRAVLFHELAHFRSLDIPVGWLFTAACALHWFNPAAHLAFRAWSRFREEAADETAIGWTRQGAGDAYGETLLYVLRHTYAQPAPFAALAIVESIQHLKKRLTMIKQYASKSPRRLASFLVFAVLAFGILLRPVRAADASDDPKTVASTLMESWLKTLDDGNYAASWDAAAPAFQKAISSADWVATCGKVRTPLGHCTARKLGSASTQSRLPSPQGAADGEFILAQFDTSFDGLKYAVETVTFQKAPGGVWKAAGYYIKPRP